MGGWIRTWDQEGGVGGLEVIWTSRRSILNDKILHEVSYIDRCSDYKNRLLNQSFVRATRVWNHCTNHFFFFNFRNLCFWSQIIYQYVLPTSLAILSNRILRINLFVYYLFYVKLWFLTARKVFETISVVLKSNLSSCIRLELCQWALNTLLSWLFWLK